MMTRAEKVIAFIEKYCVTPEGKDVGKPLVLADFQKRFIKDIYDNPHKTRRAIMTIARKNGKSALIASLLLCHVCGSEARKNTQLVSGAQSRDQAALVFNLAAKMIQLSPELSAVTRIVPSQKKIVGLSLNTEYKALAADGTTAHGLSPVLAILDESGQVQGATSPFIDAILTSQGAHDDPLQIFISTQAPSDADFLSVMVDDAIRTDDKKTVCHLYQADEDCDLLDKSQWKKANPALGIFRSEEDLEEQLKQASRLPAMEGSARNLLLNQRVALESLWLSPSAWKACNGQPDMTVFQKFPCSIGLDLSSRNDLTAAVIAAQDDQEVVHLFPFVFTPLKGLSERSQRDRAPYETWVKNKQMIAVPSETIDYGYVATYLRDQLDDMNIDIETLCFDRWRISIFKKACEDVGAFQGVRWEEIGQGYRDFSPRVESFEAKLLQGKIRHGGHPLLNLGASNAIAVSDPAGSRKLDKAKSTQRIDMIVAAVMALHSVTEGEKASLPDDLGFLIA